MCPGTYPKRDVSVTAGTGGKVFTLTGNGTSGAPSIISDIRQQRTATVALADINPDGRIDIVPGHTDCCAGGSDMRAFGVWLCPNIQKLLHKLLVLFILTEYSSKALAGPEDNYFHNLLKF